MVHIVLKNDLRTIKYFSSDSFHGSASQDALLPFSELADERDVEAPIG